MINIFFDFLKILDSKQKKRLIFLLVLIVFMSLFEVLTIISIYPFVSSLNSENNFTEIKSIKIFLDFFNVHAENYLLVLGSTFVICFFVSSLLSIVTIYKLVMISQNIGAELDNKLFKFYLYQDWTYHTKNTSSGIINKIALEAKRVTTILQSLLSLSAMSIKSIFIVICLMVLSFKITIFSIVVFIFSYFFIFKYFQKRIFFNGQNISSQQGSRLKQIKESLGSIRHLILSGNRSYFTNNFNKSSFSLARSMGHNRVMGQLPRYVIEFLAIALVVFFLLILTLLENLHIEQTMSLLSVFLIAGLRLLPSIQQIYSVFTVVRSCLPAFNLIKNDLIIENRLKHNVNELDKNNFKLRDKIKVSNLNFSYSNEEGIVKQDLDDINLEINANSIVGITGKTGAGKSTLVDLIIGFLAPQSGKITIDNYDIAQKENLAKWRNCISYVPQKVFLSDDTIYSNICFGLDKKDIDKDLFKKSLEISNLKNFVESLPDKESTRIGENGVMISGGQSQRIGIARAIYQNKDVLILDEATNQLDVETENNVLNKLKGNKKTIILITHRINTLKNLDKIIFIKNKKIISDNDFAKSINDNSFFNELHKIDK
tara:strand:- start:1346 stop:3145 length:1800 start_codon:yes stop_codon:yes gene_type:complete